MDKASDLFKELARRYARKDIDYPHLKLVTLAQWALESGWGTSPLATDHYNFGGLKWRPEMEGYATPVFYKPEHEEGEDYCKFASLDGFIIGYWRFIGRAPYTGWEEHTATGEDFINFIGPIYCPTEGYVDLVLELLGDVQELLDALPPAGEGPEPDVPMEPPAPSGPQAALARTVVIDPGHGGDAPGASSYSKVLEKDMTLEMARLTREALEQLAPQANLKLQVLLTREDDSSVAISDRPKIAGGNKAALFLCIHFNSTGVHVKMVETYVRAKKNVNPNYADDLAFAKKIQAAVYQVISQHDPQTENRGVKNDTESQHKVLGVLNDASLGEGCRACLVEVACIDVPEVDELLNTGPDAPRVRREIAGALAGAMIDELRELPA